MASYLSYRFDISNEELPKFESNKDWFDIKLFRSSKTQEKKIAVPYHARLRVVQNCCKKCVFRAPKKRHLMRGNSVRYVEAKGLSREERC